MSKHHNHDIIHDCGKFTYEYVEIFWSDTQNNWYIDIDWQSGTEVFFCPFCGAELEKIHNEHSQSKKHQDS
jgi:hypothetical protein